MRKFRLMVLVGIFTPVLAQASGLVEPVINSNNQVSVEVVRHNMAYHEMNELPGMVPGSYFNSEDGNTEGVRASIQKQAPTGSYWSGSLQVVRGYTRYNGYLVSDRDGHIMAPLHDRTFNDFADLKISRGKGYVVGRKTLVTPYLQYQVHLWNRDISKETAYQAHEFYMHQALSAGARIQQAVTDKLVVTLDANIGETILPHIWMNRQANLGSRVQAEAGLAVDYAVSRHVHLLAGYDATGFRYGRSNMVNFNYEPDSKTVQQTIHTGIAYAF